MASRDECQGKYGDELKACVLRIEELEAKSGDLLKSDRAEMTAKLDELRQKRADVWEKYEKMKSSKEGEWKTHEGSVKNAMLSLQDTIDKSYAMASRNEREGKYSDELNAVSARIEELEAKSSDVSQSDRAEMTAKLEELRQKRADVWEKYEKMRLSKEDEWQGREGGVKNAMLSLQDALDKSYARWHS